MITAIRVEELTKDLSWKPGMIPARKRRDEATTTANKWLAAIGRPKTKSITILTQMLAERRERKGAAAAALKGMEDPEKGVVQFLSLIHI